MLSLQAIDKLLGQENLSPLEKIISDNDYIHCRKALIALRQNSDITLIKAFLTKRHEKIKGSFLSYTANPASLANILCQNLAHIVQQHEPEVSLGQLLMPSYPKLVPLKDKDTVKSIDSYPFDSLVEGSKTLLPIIIIKRLENGIALNKLYNPYLEEDTPLSLDELERLCIHSQNTQRYVTLLQSKPSLYRQCQKLILSINAEKPHLSPQGEFIPATDIAIETFLVFWHALPMEEKQEIGQLKINNAHTFAQIIDDLESNNTSELKKSINLFESCIINHKGLLIQHKIDATIYEQYIAKKLDSIDLEKAKGSDKLPLTAAIFNNFFEDKITKLDVCDLASILCSDATESVKNNYAKDVSSIKIYFDLVEYTTPLEYERCLLTLANSRKDLSLTPIQLNALLLHLDEKKSFNALKALDLPSIITNINQFTTVCYALTPKKFKYLLHTFNGKFNEFTHDTDSLCFLLSHIDEQLFKTLLKKVDFNHHFAKAKNALKIISLNLSNGKEAIFNTFLINHASTLVKNEVTLINILSIYKGEQRSAFFNALKDIIPNLIKSTKGFMRAYKKLNRLDQDAYFRLMLNQMPHIIKSIQELMVVLKQLNPSHRAQFLEQHGTLLHKLAKQHGNYVLLLEQLTLSEIKTLMTRNWKDAFDSTKAFIEYLQVPEDEKISKQEFEKRCHIAKESYQFIAQKISTDLELAKVLTLLDEPQKIIFFNKVKDQLNDLVKHYLWCGQVLRFLPEGCEDDYLAKISHLFPVIFTQRKLAIDCFRMIGDDNKRIKFINCLFKACNKTTIVSEKMLDSLKEMGYPKHAFEQLLLDYSDQLQYSRKDVIDSFFEHVEHIGAIEILLKKFCAYYRLHHKQNSTLFFNSWQKLDPSIGIEDIIKKIEDSKSPANNHYIQIAKELNWVDHNGGFLESAPEILKEHVKSFRQPTDYYSK
jgi:hypothetical protein